MIGREIKASYFCSERRRLRNQHEAAFLQKDGYIVEKCGHPNGAYFAFIGDHQEHEKTAGQIFAENGFSFTLDYEGRRKVWINGKLYTLPSPDGRVEGFSHEIYALRGEPNIQKVVDAITHSRKAFFNDMSKTIQSDVAISIAPNGSKYNNSHIARGVDEYMRRVANGETKAKPLLYLHVNETSRNIYQWVIK